MVADTSIASICSVTFIDPSSAAIFDPTFPAQIRAVTSGANALRSFAKGDPVVVHGRFLEQRFGHGPDTDLTTLRKLCDDHGMLLIFDEIQTGVGRTGKFFAYDWLGFTPDIMPVAKGITSGYIPLGAVMFNDRLADVLSTRGGELAHGYTYSGHPVCAAVALENIRILQEERIVERCRDDIGPYLAERWRQLGEHPLVGEARILGMVGALELVPDKRRRAYFPDRGRVGAIHCPPTCT